jgi:hypothetical protein
MLPAPSPLGCLQFSARFFTVGWIRRGTPMRINDNLIEPPLDPRRAGKVCWSRQNGPPHPVFSVSSGPKDPSSASPSRPFCNGWLESNESVTMRLCQVPIRAQAHCTSELTRGWKAEEVGTRKNWRFAPRPISADMVSSADEWKPMATARGAKLRPRAIGDSSP